MTARDVARRASQVRRRIKAAGGDGRVRIVAVTKGFDVRAAEWALRAGVHDLGESYAQELLAKAPEVASADARWHFVGRLQTNKVRLLADTVHLWQSVDRGTVADELAKRVPDARVLVQVNVSREPQKGGCVPAETAPLVRRLRRAGLEVAGLMCVGATGTPEDARPGFRLLSRLADDLGLDERSMGMSDDLEVAVEEGSTMVRVGRALFGDRPRAGAAGSRD